MMLRFLKMMPANDYSITIHINSIFFIELNKFLAQITVSYSEYLLEFTIFSRSVLVCFEKVRKQEFLNPKIKTRVVWNLMILY